MNIYEVHQTVNKILEGHRRAHYDMQEAVSLLAIFTLRSNEEVQQQVFQALWSVLASEPLDSSTKQGHISPNVHAVAIRAFAAFGPTAELPARVFGLLRWDKPEQMNLWAERVCPQLTYSLAHYEHRFAQSTLDQTKAFCATYTYAGAAGLTGASFPESLIGAVTALQEAIEYVEFSRFAASLKETQAKPAPQPVQLEGILVSLGLPTIVAEAMHRAESYLESQEPFSPKHAGDLMRASMEEAHRAVVLELEKMTGRQCSNPEKDGVRRQYMREASFITPAEETFFSNIYTLISDESSHKLDAPKETMLVVQRTVKDYLLLLLRRLANRRTSAPQLP